MKGYAHEKKVQNESDLTRLYLKYYRSMSELTYDFEKYGRPDIFYGVLKDMDSGIEPSVNWDYFFVEKNKLRMDYEIPSTRGEEKRTLKATYAGAKKADGTVELDRVMMLEHLGEMEMAERIRKAIADVVAEGKVRAYDMLKLKGSPDVIKQGAASTKQMADSIIEKLK